MAKRGRPPHPDILTPREWEVLELLRQGLSNPEIASRLAISRDGAKYHVSAILGKLGVESREDAARWRYEESRPWWIAAFAPFHPAGRQLSSIFGSVAGSAASVVSITVLVTAIGGLGLLTFLLMRDGGDQTQSSPTGIAEIDTIIDAVERQDVEALRGFVAYQQIACDSPTADGYVIPPTCPEGVPPGTAVDAFLGGGCHPNWKRPEEVADRFSHVRDFPHIAYAVYRIEESFAEVEAEYRVVISAPSEPRQERSSQLGISGSSVVWLVGGCSNVKEQIASLEKAGAEAIYLAPESSALTPTAPNP